MTKIPLMPATVMRGDAFDALRNKNIEQLQTDDIQRTTHKALTSITMTLPNDTILKVEGDPDVILQVIGHLSGIEITVREQQGMKL